MRNRLKRLSQEGKIIPQRGGRYGSLTNVPTVSGTLKAHYEGYGFVISDDPAQTDVFIPAKNMNYALPGDRVVTSVMEGRGDGKREGKILQILERGRTHWIGRFERQGKGFAVINEERQKAVEILIPGRHLKGARPGQMVVVRVTRFPASGRPMMGEVAEVLGSPRDESAETAAILVKHRIRKNFPPKVTEEVQRQPEEISEEELKRRVDLRPLPILTIDGITARDFDDAVFVEKKGLSFHLYVSIADVAHYVASGGTTDHEALERGTSTYFPDFAVPMLPEKLSNGLCSLNPGQDRLTLTAEIRFDETGQAQEAWYYESVIRSQKRGIYEEVQSFFDGASDAVEACPVPLRQSLDEMKKLAELLMVQRGRRGSIDFDLPEADIRYDKEGRISAIVKAERFFSHRLIEEFMISANVAVAELFSRLELPFLYRIHDLPDPAKVGEFLLLAKNLGVRLPSGSFKQAKDFARLLETIKTDPAEPLIHQVLLRSMRIALYSPENRGHFGLNLKTYCHFTSPIRRYPDLVVHRQLKFLLHGSKTGKIHLVFGRGVTLPPSSLRSFYNHRDVEYFGDQSSKREREAMEAEREMLKLKQALFMQDHVGDKFFGTIRRVAKFGLFVELEPHFVEGLLHVSDLTDDYYRFDDKRLRFVGTGKKRKIYQVGDKIRVTVRDVSVENRQISLESA